MITILLFTTLILCTAGTFDLSNAECNNMSNKIIESLRTLQSLGKTNNCLRGVLRDFLSPDNCLTISDSELSYVT